LLGVTVLATVLLFIFERTNKSTELKINEIAYSFKNESDWIEIYNPSDKEVSLKGYYLTDRKKNFTKFRIEENVVLSPKDFVVIYCEKYSNPDTSLIVTNFNISVGETIYLIGKNGRTIIDTLTVVPRRDDIKEFSIARFPDGSNEIYTTTDYTPGEANSISD
ncbi:lamin tail domain-containing protein, partial [Candidatus Dojkabacteria bacterium]|nr:lamin tail domain-containing protein [Candidatus Dojkabacteria bacterium]